MKRFLFSMPKLGHFFRKLATIGIGMYAEAFKQHHEPLYYLETYLLKYV